MATPQTGPTYTVLIISAPGTSDQLLVITGQVDVESVRARLAAADRFPAGFVIQVPTVGTWEVGEGSPRGPSPFPQSKERYPARPFAPRAAAVWTVRDPGFPDRVVATAPDVDADSLVLLERRTATCTIERFTKPCGFWPLQQTISAYHSDGRGIDQEGFVAAVPS